MFDGIIARPRATSLRTVSGSSFSRVATYCISSVITPSRAKCICDIFRLPFAPAATASLFSIHPSLIAMGPSELGKTAKQLDARRRPPAELHRNSPHFGNHKLWHPVSSKANMTYRSNPPKCSAAMYARFSPRPLDPRVSSFSLFPHHSPLSYFSPPAPPTSHTCHQSFSAPPPTPATTPAAFPRSPSLSD